MDQYKGECLFIRSWYNFMLYKVFGGVPIISRVVSPVEVKGIARCTDSEMLECLETDLKEAIRLLPATRPAEKARVSKIAAQALLGKVYLTYKMYPEAEAVLSGALADSGYGLMPTTAAAFDVSNKMNKEIIFALCYNKSNSFGHGYWWSSNTGVEADRRIPTPQSRALFDEAKDNRWPLIHDFIKISSSVYAMPKWNDTYDATYTDQVGNDFPLIRYADVVLSYAEALGLGGRIPDAIPYLNQTRTRAGLDPLPDGPMTETNSPFSTEKLTLSSAFTSVSPSPYVFVSPSTLSISIFFSSIIGVLSYVYIIILQGDIKVNFKVTFLSFF
jgi:hypothetical protein